MSSYTYIDRQQQLDLALSQLSGAGTLAVDTESSGFYTYFSEICLIQLSAGGYHYIVDALAGLKLDGLGRIFADKGVIKIFHGAASDITEMRRAYDWKFENVFDTFLACRMLNHESCSLAHLVQQYMGVTLKKKEQKSNWKKRPLTRSQLDYAHLDTVYLEDLREKLIAEIQDPRLLEELGEDFADAANREIGPDKPFNHDGWVRLPNALAHSPEERGLLKKLYEIREHRARKDNIASFRMMSNEAMVKIAARKPGTEQELAAMNAGSPAFIRKEGKRIVEACGQSHAPIQDGDLPKRDEIEEHLRGILKGLKRWRTHVSEYRRMDTSMILNNRALEALAREQPDTTDKIAAMGIMTDWKLKNYGEQILQVLKQGFRADRPPNVDGFARAPVRESAGESSS